METNMNILGGCNGLDGKKKKEKYKYKYKQRQTEIVAMCLR